MTNHLHQNPHLPLLREGRIALLSSSWHAELVQQTVKAASRTLQEFGWQDERIECFELPGAYEFPLFARNLARSGRYQALIACALVVDGGIYRHDFVAHAVIDGLMRVQLDEGMPIFSAVLTPQQFHEHEVHHAFFMQHLHQKGIEAAQACARTLAAHARLNALGS